MNDQLTPRQLVDEVRRFAGDIEVTHGIDFTITSGEHRALSATVKGRQRFDR